MLPAHEHPNRANLRQLDQTLYSLSKKHRPHLSESISQKMLNRAVKDFDMTKQVSCHPTPGIKNPVPSIEHPASGVWHPAVAYGQLAIANCQQKAPLPQMRWFTFGMA